MQGATQQLQEVFGMTDNEFEEVLVSYSVHELGYKHLHCIKQVKLKNLVKMYMDITMTQSQQTPGVENLIIDKVWISYQYFLPLDHVYSQA